MRIPIIDYQPKKNIDDNQQNKEKLISSVNIQHSKQKIESCICEHIHIDLSELNSSIIDINTNKRSIAYIVDCSWGNNDLDYLKKQEKCIAKINQEAKKFGYTHFTIYIGGGKEQPREHKLYKSISFTNIFNNAILYKAQRQGYDLFKTNDSIFTNNNIDLFIVFTTGVIFNTERFLSKFSKTLNLKFCLIEKNLDEDEKDAASIFKNNNYKYLIESESISKIKFSSAPPHIKNFSIDLEEINESSLIYLVSCNQNKFFYQKYIISNDNKPLLDINTSVTGIIIISEKNLQQTQFQFAFNNTLYHHQISYNNAINPLIYNELFNNYVVNDKLFNYYNLMYDVGNENTNISYQCPQCLFTLKSLASMCSYCKHLLFLKNPIIHKNSPLFKDVGAIYLIIDSNKNIQKFEKVKDDICLDTNHGTISFHWNKEGNCWEFNAKNPKNPFHIRSTTEEFVPLTHKTITSQYTIIEIDNDKKCFFIRL